MDTVENGSMPFNQVKLLCDELINGYEYKENILKYVYQIRKITCLRNPPVEFILKTDVLPYLINLLSSYDDELIIELTWIFCNLTSETKGCSFEIAKSGLISNIFELFCKVENPLILENCAWVFSNLAAESIDIGSYILKIGYAEQVFKIINNKTCSERLIKTFTWSFCNLSFYNMEDKKIEIEYYKPILECIKHLIYKELDNDIVFDLCNTLSNLTKLSSSILIKFDINIEGKLVELAKSDHELVQLNSIRAIGYIIAGREEETQKMIDAKILDVLPIIFNNFREQLRIEGFWILSNIAAGLTSQKKEIIKSNLVKYAIMAIQKDTIRIQKEAMYVIVNLISGGNVEIINHVVNKGGIIALCQLLRIHTSYNPEFVIRSLEGLIKIFESNPNKIPDYLEQMDNESNSIALIEELMLDNNEDVSRLAQIFIDDYTKIDEEIDDDNIIKQVSGFDENETFYDYINDDQEIIDN